MNFCDHSIIEGIMMTAINFEYFKISNGFTNLNGLFVNIPPGQSHKHSALAPAN